MQMGIAHQEGCSQEDQVLQGPTNCKRIYGVNYYETFTPVTKLASICTILTITACNNWPIGMFDFHSAFLNRQLDEDEEIFMEQPSDYEESNPQKYCVKFYKSIYGLKQARHKWYEIACHMLADLGFKKCEANPAIFYIHAGEDILIFAIHVDMTLVFNHINCLSYILYYYINKRISSCYD